MYEHLIADRRCWTLTRTHKEKIHGLNVTSMLLCTTLKSMLTSKFNISFRHYNCYLW